MVLHLRSPPLHRRWVIEELEGLGNLARGVGGSDPRRLLSNSPPGDRQGHHDTRKVRALNNSY